ncbi:hypothetical protein LXA43DRAFT_1133618 [Ganoderma leucocontextum]|nr:hypothetical protein LXA43DRAFT_1133618 [Ganoderma leucocontextum]
MVGNPSLLRTYRGHWASPRKFYSGGLLFTHPRLAVTKSLEYRLRHEHLGTPSGRPVLLTEIGASGTVAEQQAFLEKLIPFLDGLDAVTHFAWYMVTGGNLVSGDGSLTALGSTYASTQYTRRPTARRFVLDDWTDVLTVVSKVWLAIRSRPAAVAPCSRPLIDR